VTGFKILVLVLSLLANCCSLFANQDTSKYALKALKIEVKITIDGKDDELVWQQNKNIADNFYQNFPYDTSFAQSKTSVKICYDNNNLYVFARCFDTIKKPYIIQSLKRDWSYPRSDAFVVSIEPFNDYNNGFSFGANPFGAQREGLIEIGGNGGVTTAWDNKWFCETNQTDSCWTAEFQIPLKSIRFNENVPYWRINFARNNLKINENSTWYPIPRQLNIAVLSHMGKLFFDIMPKKQGFNAAFIPYVAHSLSKDYVKNNAVNHIPNIGFDAKLVLTSSLNLDITTNPDFSQVDVDVQQINLSRFSLFFPERRQFFIENSDLFASFGFRQIRPFFSRNIGLVNGNIVPIIGGVRLSGKLNKNWRVGAMSVATANNSKYNIGNQNYAVAAVQRNVFKSSNIAAIIVNKFSASHHSIAQKNNTLIGLDYNLISKSNIWRGKLFYHQTLDNFLFKKRKAAHASWLMYNTQKWFAMWNHEYVSKDFNAEVGFTPRLFVFDGKNKITYRQSYWRIEPEIKRKFYPKSSLINRAELGIYNSTYADSSYQINDMINQFYSNIFFQNSATLTFSYSLYNTLLYFPIDISGKDSTLAAGRYHYQDFSINFTSNNRRKFSFEAGARAGSFYIGNKFTVNGALSYRFQPHGIISLDIRRDEIQMPTPYKTTVLNLIGPKIEWAFSKTFFTTIFVQYNTQSENMNINARLQYRFAPMSDLFIVFSDNYTPNQTLLFGNPNFPYLNIRNRALTIKLSYWLNS